MASVFSKAFRKKTRQFVAFILSKPLGVTMHCKLYLFLVVNSREYKSNHSQQYYVVTGFDTERIFLTLYVQYIKK